MSISRHLSLHPLTDLSFISPHLKMIWTDRPIDRQTETSKWKKTGNGICTKQICGWYRQRQRG